MKNGEDSDIIKSPFGYHVFMKKRIAFDDVKEILRKDFEKACKNEIHNEIIESKKLQWVKKFN